MWSVDPPAVAARAGGDLVAGWPILGPRKFAWSPAAERVARTAAVDLVHQHGLWTAQAFVTAAFRRRRIATVITPHGTLEPGAMHHSSLRKRMALHCFESRNLAAASCLHATSFEELKTFRHRGLTVPVAVIANGVTPDWLESEGDGEAFRDRHGLGRGKRILLFLSRLHAKKGLPLLVGAVAAQRSALGEWQVVIAGNDEQRHQQEIERLARRLGVAEMIRFVGPVYGSDKRDAYAAADLFVLPTSSENFGLVVAEALAAGIPVLTTHGAPWAELEEHDCGWWVPVDTTAIGDALADAVRRSPSERRAMGQRGQALVRAKYTWPAVADKTIELYRWLLGHGSQPSFVSLD